MRLLQKAKDVIADKLTGNIVKRDLCSGTYCKHRNEIKITRYFAQPLDGRQNTG